MLIFYNRCREYVSILENEAGSDAGRQWEKGTLKKNIRQNGQKQYTVNDINENIKNGSSFPFRIILKRTKLKINYTAH